jgi:hypothetical protein
MKNKIVYYALGAVALYYLYDWYKKKMPGTPIIQTTNQELIPSVGIQQANALPVSMTATTNDLAPGLSIVSDLINAATPTAPVKEIPIYQTFYGESLNGVKVAKVPMTC